MSACHCPKCGAVCIAEEVSAADGISTYTRYRPIGDSALAEAYRLACEDIAKLKMELMKYEREDTGLHQGRGGSQEGET
jgi:hypothetical protein